ncbi:hypothetical protein WJX72_012381 [[Myrmecia] bisecta]|uniref:CNNM transmembrane domain-containing protein n=1 Tax=[Myrmecia] bisecta TaxID=41462 RepID=A0AAW1QGQ4_9CHLO
MNAAIQHTAWNLLASGLGLDPDAKNSEVVFYSCASVALTLFAGLMSGLTLGLMSLDDIDLEVLKRSGTPSEQKYAARIEPVVKKPHWLLVTLLLNNAAAMEALPIFLDRLFSPAVAIMLSVTAVLFFGEIIPQALCSRHGLIIGAYSAWFVQLLMYLTAPVSYPISKVLDYLLGEQHSALFRRAQLKALVDIHSQEEGLGGNLSTDEINIIRGALDLTSKTAQTAMTPLDKVFMLASDEILNKETMSRVLANGHSRIPVHRPGNRKDIMGLLLVKELVLLDLEANIPVSAIKMRSLPYLKGDTPMYDLLKLFQTGRSHMVVLTKPGHASASRTTSTTLGAGDNTMNGDAVSIQVDHDSVLSDAAQESAADLAEQAASDIAEPTGVITIEDVLEELLQQEIVDETDQYVDNERMEKVNAALMVKNLPLRLRKLLVVRGREAVTHTSAGTTPASGRPRTPGGDDGGFRAPANRAAASAMAGNMANDRRIQQAIDVLQPLLSPEDEAQRANSQAWSVEEDVGNLSAADAGLPVPRIIVFKDKSYLPTIRDMCSSTSEASPECQFAGMCKRVYAGRIISGIAGDFSADQVDQWKRCLPGAILYHEPDSRVRPDPDKRAYASEYAGYTAPQDPALDAANQALATAASSFQRSGLATDMSSVAPNFATGAKAQRLQLASWGLDRIDQRYTPLNKLYKFGSTGAFGTGRGVTLYTLDSGVRLSHQEFQPWPGDAASAARASYGYNFLTNEKASPDCDGHGTHVASTAVGRMTGAAKEAKVVAVRVLDCDGSGTVSDVVAGLDWVAKNAVKPALVTLSLGISVGQWSRTLEEAVRSLVVNQNITIIVASGNSGVDSCTVAPANVAEVITVAASDLDNKFGNSTALDADELYKYSNTGVCTDIFAPGVDILAACGSADRCQTLNDTAYAWASGTSMAVPLVAGAVAAYLGDHPYALPAEVKQALNDAATVNRLPVSDLLPGTPNRLLYTLGLSNQPMVTAAQGPPAGR